MCDETVQVWWEFRRRVLQMSHEGLADRLLRGYVAERLVKDDWRNIWVWEIIHSYTVIRCIHPNSVGQSVCSLFLNDLSNEVWWGIAAQSLQAFKQSPLRVMMLCFIITTVLCFYCFRIEHKRKQLFLLALNIGLKSLYELLGAIFCHSCKYGA